LTKETSLIHGLAAVSTHAGSHLGHEWFVVQLHQSSTTATGAGAVRRRWVSLPKVLLNRRRIFSAA
jgi:hypothetical protein